MKKHLQIKGELVELSEADSFIETSLLPADLPIGRVVSPVRFIKMQKFTKSLYTDRVGSKIEIRDIEDLKYATCIVFGNGEGYIAVTPRGEIVSLLKSPSSRMNNFMGQAFANAIMVGGNRLDCFNCDDLGPSYCRRGFIPICRLDFDPDIDPAMAKLYGDECKEIIFFIYCGDPVYTYWKKMQDGEYIPYDQYEFIPHIGAVQKAIGLDVNGSDYDFAGRFRDMVWGRWNGGLKDEYMFRPNKLMNYICNDKARLTEWMSECRHGKDK